MYLPQAKWLGFLGAIVLVPTVAAVEVDLVFPRNESYSPPADWFPIVFAVQNTSSAELLNLHMFYDIRMNNDVNNQTTFTHDFRWANWSGSADPYFAYQYVRNLLTTGPWSVAWELRWQSCDEEALANMQWSSGYYYQSLWNHHYSGLLFFTIDDTSPQDVDLVATTANTPVLETVNTAGRDTCVVTTNSTTSPTRTTPDPCRVAIDEDSAASMAAAHHTQLCDGLNPPEDCPRKKNGAQPLVARGIIRSLAALGVAGVLLL